MFFVFLGQAVFFPVSWFGIFQCCWLFHLVKISITANLAFSWSVLQKPQCWLKTGFSVRGRKKTLFSCVVFLHFYLLVLFFHLFCCQMIFTCVLLLQLHATLMLHPGLFNLYLGGHFVSFSSSKDNLPDAKMLSTSKYSKFELNYFWKSNWNSYTTTITFPTW